MREMNMVATLNFPKGEIQPSRDVNVIADRLAEMMAVQFFNTILESLDQDLNKGMYNYFLAEGIVKHDEKAGLKEHFKTGFLQQLQKNVRGGDTTSESLFTNERGYGLSVYNKIQAQAGEEEKDA